MASAHTIIMQRARKTAEEHDNPFWVTDVGTMRYLVAGEFAAFTPGGMIRLTARGVQYIKKEADWLANAGRGRRRAG